MNNNNDNIIIIFISTTIIVIIKNYYHILLIKLILWHNQKCIIFDTKMDSQINYIGVYYEY